MTEEEPKLILLEIYSNGNRVDYKNSVTKVNEGWLLIGIMEQIKNDMLSQMRDTDDN